MLISDKDLRAAATGIAPQELPHPFPPPPIDLFPGNSKYHHWKWPPPLDIRMTVVGQVTMPEFQENVLDKVMEHAADMDELVRTTPRARLRRQNVVPPPPSPELKIIGLPPAPVASVWPVGIAASYLPPYPQPPKGDAGIGALENFMPPHELEIVDRLQQ